MDRNRRIRIKTVLDQLGIRFRPGEDDWLWSHHGVETVVNYGGYATYLTHETDDAVRDGKELYYLNELVNNLTEDEIIAVRQGYMRVSAGSRKVTPKELVELDDAAYKLGYDLKNFEDWYGQLSFNVRSHAKMKTIRESYDRGVAARIAENSEVLRLCVYIKGDPNTGKTFASKHALSGKAVLTIEGGGTGKFDNLRPDHDAIIVSDDVCPNLLNMTDNYICRAYRRQSRNPAWAGKYFVVTSNLSFEEWLSGCGVKKADQIDAMRSRFYICEILRSDDGTNYLALQSPSTRGSKEEQMRRVDMFLDFKKKFDTIMKDYHPMQIDIDYDSIIDPDFSETGILEREIQLNEQRGFDAVVRFANWYWLTGTYAPVRIMQTYAGTLMRDPALVDDVARQMELPKKLSDEIIRRLANAFAKDSDFSEELMDSISAGELRTAIELCWSSHPAFDLGEDPDDMIQSHRYSHPNPYVLPEQIDLTPKEPDEEHTNQGREHEMVYDVERNIMLKDVTYVKDLIKPKASADEAFKY